VEGRLPTDWAPWASPTWLTWESTAAWSCAASEAAAASARCTAPVAAARSAWSATT